MPSITGGSSDATKLHDSFAKLYKVVRFSYASYFGNDVDKAVSVFTEAEQLFQQLNNTKAVGIANNNLGNTYLTILKQDDWTGIYDEADVAAKAKTCFGKAVESAEHALEAAGAPVPVHVKRTVQRQLSSESTNHQGILVSNVGVAVGVASEYDESNLATFETQLANRLFNRGIFQCRHVYTQGTDLFDRHADLLLRCNLPGYVCLLDVIH